jgi:hypothetical protein
MSNSSQPATSETISTTSTLDGDSSLPLAGPISTSSSSCSSFSNNISPSTFHSPQQQQQKLEKQQEQIVTMNVDEEKLESKVMPDSLHIAQQMSIINSILNTNTKISEESNESIDRQKQPELSVDADKEQKVRSIDQYEKRFQDSLKLLNAPKWLAAARKSPLELSQHKRQKCTANSSNRQSFGPLFSINASNTAMPNIMSTTKQKYDRIRQKYRQQQNQQQYLNVNGNLAGVTSSLSSVDSGRYSRSKSSDSHGLTILVDNADASASNTNGPLSAGSYAYYSSQNNILYNADNEPIINGVSYDRSTASVARRSFNKLNSTSNNHQQLKQEQQRYLLADSTSAASFVASSCSSSSLLRANNSSSTSAQPAAPLLLLLSGSKSHSALNSGMSSAYSSEAYSQDNENGPKRNLCIPHRSHMSLHTMCPSGSILTSSLSCTTMNNWYKPKSLKLPTESTIKRSADANQSNDYDQTEANTATNMSINTIITKTTWNGN